MGQWWPAAWLGALSVAVYAWDPLKEVTIIFITSTIVWPQVNGDWGQEEKGTTEDEMAGWHHQLNEHESE